MNANNFLPPRQRGIFILGGILLALGALTVWGLQNATRAEVGPVFLTYILITFLGALPLPLIGYRLYALLRANYHLQRDHLKLRWGLRIEEIPLNDIEWVRPASDLTIPLRLPRFRLPGSILGVRRHPDLGAVEFLAADAQNLLLIATAKRVFAISPADPRRFAREFQLAAEMGSLTPSSALSSYPSFIVVEAWKSLLARYLWLSGLLLNIGLLAWTSFLSADIHQVPLGFSAAGIPLGPYPAIQLMLLPLISMMLFFLGWLAGLYFYRWEEQRILAFIVWISSALTGILFLVAVLFAVAAPV